MRNTGSFTRREQDGSGDYKHNIISAMMADSWITVGASPPGMIQHVEGRGRCTIECDYYLPKALANAHMMVPLASLYQPCWVRDMMEEFIVTIA